jgi:hypothetical protein
LIRACRIYCENKRPYSFSYTHAQRETRFAYDGDNIVAELDGTNTILRRYVYEPGATTPFLWYEGVGLTDKRWLHADERGSIIAVSNGMEFRRQVRHPRNSFTLRSLLPPLGNIL